MLKNPSEEKGKKIVIIQIMKSSAREFTLTLTRVEMPRVGGDGHRLPTWIRRENGARRRGWWRCCRCGRRSFGSFLGLLFRHWLRWLLQQKIKLNSKVNRNRVLLATNIGNLKPVIKCLSTPIWLAVLWLIDWCLNVLEGGGESGDDAWEGLSYGCEFSG